MTNQQINELALSISNRLENISDRLDLASNKIQLINQEIATLEADSNSSFYCSFTLGTKEECS